MIISLIFINSPFIFIHRFVNMIYSFEQCQKFFNHAFHEQAFGKSPENLYHPVQYILSSGGKRLRPVLMLMAYNMFDDEISHVIYPAMAIEIFHNFTLVHDDIMDESPIRRNQPTVHKKWNANTAVLSGDAMSILAYSYLVKLTHPGLADIIRLFNETALQVCEGQQYDMDFEHIHHVSEESYLTMIKLKTAVLIACSLKMGAIIANASPEDAERIYDFGIDIGMAFQLQDDLLDTYGNETSFGKSIGNDIKMNKKTYLLIKALELSNENQRMELQNAFQGKMHDGDAKIKKVIDIYDSLGIQEKTLKKISDYFQHAHGMINNIKVEADRKRELEKLINNLEYRSH